MAVLIPDMQMPERCDDCRLCEGETMDGLCHAAGKWFDDEYFQWFQYEEYDVDSTKPVNCTLVEIPKTKLPMTDKELEECNFEL